MSIASSSRSGTMPPAAVLWPRWSLRAAVRRRRAARPVAGPSGTPRGERRNRGKLPRSSPGCHPRPGDLANPGTAPSRPPLRLRARLRHLLEARPTPLMREVCPDWCLYSGRCPGSRRALSTLLRPLERARQAGGPDRVCLGRRHVRSETGRLVRGQVLDLRAGRPGRLLRDLRRRDRRSGSLQAATRAGIGGFAPNEHGHYPIEPLGVDLGVWHGFYLNETGPVAAMVRHAGKSAATR